MISVLKYREIKTFIKVYIKKFSFETYILRLVFLRVATKMQTVAAN